jgi:maltoporin
MMAQVRGHFASNGVGVWGKLGVGVGRSAVLACIDLYSTKHQSSKIRRFDIRRSDIQRNDNCRRNDIRRNGIQRSDIRRSGR